MGKSIFPVLALTLAAAASAAPAVSISLVVDTTTTIPGGLGSFTSFAPVGLPPSPCISFGNAAFFGAGAAGAGVYAAFGGVLSRIADQNTTVPGGTQDTKFIIWQSNPALSGGTEVFAAGASGTHEGLYAVTAGALTTIADVNTLVPGSTDKFIIWQSPAISGSNVVFLGQGAGGEKGVYVSYPSSPLAPLADLNTLVPGSADKFIIWQSPAISGNNVAFLGQGAGGEKGVYVSYPPSSIASIATNAIAVPGQPAGTLFSQFLSVSLAGANVAFVGGFPVGKSLGTGVYVSFPASPVAPIADNTTPVPGGMGNFGAFDMVAIDPSHVVFEGYSVFNAAVLKGLYTNLGGSLSKIVDLNDTLGGKTLSDLHFGPGGFSGNQVVFEADFTDGSHGIYLATINGGTCPLSQGYWKNHPSAWPETSLTLGSQNYTQAELLALLNASDADASVVLARQLIAAKLDVANGSSVNPVSAVIADADGLLSGFAGKLPYNVQPASAAGAAMLADASTLDNYNNALLTPGCTN